MPVILLTLCEVIAQFVLKKSSNLGTVWTWYFYLGVALYAFIGFLFYQSLKYYKFGLVNIIWHICFFIATLGIGLFVFKEKYTIYEKMGVLFGLISICLFSLGE